MDTAIALRYAVTLFILLTCPSCKACDKLLCIVISFDHLELPAGPLTSSDAAMLLHAPHVKPLGQRSSIRRGNLVVANVACTAGKNPTSRPAKRSKVEFIKENSDHLRHPLMEELVNDETFITEDSVQLMKFHGSYQVRVGR